MVNYTDITKFKSWFLVLYKWFPIILQWLFALRMYLNLSVRVREVKEVSKSDKQLKKVERKWSKAGHNITKWKPQKIRKGGKSMPFSLTWRRRDVYQALSLRAGYQATARGYRISLEPRLFHSGFCLAALEKNHCETKSRMESLGSRLVPNRFARASLKPARRWKTLCCARKRTDS